MYDIVYQRIACMHPVVILIEPTGKQTTRVENNIIFVNGSFKLLASITWRDLSNCNSIKVNDIVF